jgi:hypothetical protein
LNDFNIKGLIESQVLIQFKIDVNILIIKVLYCKQITYKGF